MEEHELPDPQGDPKAALDLAAWARQKLGLPIDSSEADVLQALEKRLNDAGSASSPDAESSIAQLTTEVNDVRAEAQAARKLAAELREQRTQEKRRHDEEVIESARRASARAGAPIPEETCKLALSLFAKDEDEAARKLLAAYSASRASRRGGPEPLVGSRVAALDERVTLSRDSAERLLLEHDGWIVKTTKNGALKRDANGRPKLVRRSSRER